jgi:hypothetical protein
MGLTHIELADALDSILRCVKEDGSLSVDPAALLSSLAKQSQVKLEQQKLVFRSYMTEGTQESLFHNAKQPQSPESTFGTSSEFV